MSDSDIRFEAPSTGDCRLFCFSAGKWPLRHLGLLQQYPPENGHRQKWYWPLTAGF
jgi:hypothetical protein